MGLLSWIFGEKKNYSELPIKVTKKRQLKLELLAAEAIECSTKSERVFVVCHFEETLELLQEQFKSKEKKCNLLTRALDNAGLERMLHEPAFGEIELVQSKFLKVAADSNPTKFVSNDKVAVILVAEKSPIRAHDLVVLDLASCLPFQCKNRYFISLDDFLASVSLGPWARTMLEKMGFGDDECIENQMIGRRFSDAQNRLELDPNIVKNLHSETEWFDAHASAIDNLTKP